MTSGRPALRILMYLHTRSGGHWRYVSELVSGLSGMGQVAIVCAVGSEPAPGLQVDQVLSAIDEQAHGLTRIVDRQRIYGRHVRELGRLLKRDRQIYGPGVVHFQELPSLRGRAVVDAARDYGYKTVITVHNVYPHTLGRVSWLRQRDAIAAWSHADRLIVHTSQLRVELEGLLPNANVAVVPHPLWPVTRCPEQTQLKEFLFFGVLRENKGIWRFVKALVELGNPNASIIGAGSESMEKEISTSLKELGLSRCEFLPGYLPEDQIPAMFAAHRVLVAPYESFAAQSGVTHLAIAHRRPVVVTDVGGLADPVKDFKVGEIAVGGVKELAEAMSVAAGRQREHAYDEGFEAANAFLSINAVAKATMQVYESSLGRVRD